MLRYALALFAALSTPSVAAPIVRDAVVVNLIRDDLTNLASGVKEYLFGYAPTRGVYEIPYGTSFEGFYPDRFRYEFEVPTLNLTPSYGAITLDAEIRNLKVFVDRVGLDPQRARACYGLHVTSLSSPIPIRIKAVPRVTESGRLELRLDEVSIGLTRSNFYFHGVDRCEVLGPIDGLIARMVPAMANGTQAQIAQHLTGLVQGMVGALNQQVDKLFSAEYVLPVVLPPLGRMTARVRTFPTALDIDETRAALVLGVQGTVTEYGLMRPQIPHRPYSYVGVSPAFVNATLAEGLKNGAFKARIDATTQPDWAPLFTGEVLYDLIPDSQTRYQADDQTALLVQGAEALTFSLLPQPDPTHLPFAVTATNMRTRIEAAGEPYYDFTVSGTTPLEVALDRKTATVSLSFKSLTGLKLTGGDFVPGLDPLPRGEDGLTPEKFSELTAFLDEIMSQGGTAVLLNLRLPNLRVGNTWVNYWSFAEAGDFMVFDIRLRRM